MESKLTKKQQELYDAGVKAGIELEKTENLALIKRMEQRKLQEEDAEVKRRLNELLTIIDPQFIVTDDPLKGLIYINKQPVDTQRLLNLRAEAEFLANSELWKIIYETIKDNAQRTMFINSKTLDDLQKGKSMLYTLDLQRQIVELFKKVKRK